MPRYAYAIGTTAGNLTNIEALSVNPPKGRFYEIDQYADRNDGHLNGRGFARAIWEFDVLTQDMISTLRGYCPGASSDVYITTRKPDGIFESYRAIMTWPRQQMDRRNFNGRHLGVEIAFQIVEASYAQRMLGVFGSDALAVWPKTEISGTVANSVPNSALNGTYQFNPSLNGATFIDGSPAVRYTGGETQQACDIFSAALASGINKNEFSMGIWLKPDAATWTTPRGGLIQMGNPDFSEYVSLHRSFQDNEIIWLYRGSPTPLQHILTPSPLFTDWRLMVITLSISSDAVHCYLNDWLVASFSSVATWDSGPLANFCYIGMQPGAPPATFVGGLSHGFVVNRALTRREISELIRVV